MYRRLTGSALRNFYPKFEEQVNTVKKDRVKLMCAAGVFTAVIVVFTAYFHIPSHTGYTHVGDGFIYLTACLLPFPFAVFVGAGGALLADCLTGFVIWAPGSAIIKAVAVLFFSSRTRKIVTVRNILALLPAAILCIGGYYFYESLITGNFTAPLAGIPGYITQSVLSSLLFLLVGMAADRLNLKKYL